VQEEHKVNSMRKNGSQKKAGRARFAINPWSDIFRGISEPAVIKLFDLLKAFGVWFAVSLACFSVGIGEMCFRTGSAPVFFRCLFNRRFICLWPAGSGQLAEKHWHQRKSRWPFVHGLRFVNWWSHYYWVGFPPLKNRRRCGAGLHAVYEQLMRYRRDSLAL